MGLKKNILYSGFLTTSLYIFQFITYPYVARVLGVTNIGICNFVQSVVQYFALFCMLGISTLGVREIAKCNGDKEKLNKTFSQLFTLNISFTLIVLVIYWVMIETVPQFIPYKKLLYIGASQLFFGAFAVEWLFRGLEEFKYITIRTMLVRILYVVAVFLFVRKSEDYGIYFIISSGMIVANGIINWSYGTKFVKFNLPSFSSIKYYIRPLLFLGSQFILTSLYTTFNTVYLGMTCGDVQVGYYTTATKIENIILALYSSFTLVMMPRISALMEKNSKEGIRRMIQQSFNLLFAFVFPCIIVAEFYAEELVYLVAGTGYEGAVLPMRIVMPAMLVVGIEQILIIQILMPNRNDKEVFVNSILGAACGLILNVLLVSKLESVGSSVVWLICELIVMYSALRYVKLKHSYTLFPKRELYFHLIFFTPLALFLYLLSLLNLTSLISFIAGCTLTAIYSHLALRYFIKNQTYISILQYLKLSEK